MPDDPSPTFIGALVNEQFGLQSASSATISESSSRAALYFSSLSSALVAIGFASSSPAALAGLAFTVLPTVFVLGCFTVVRLVDTSVQNLVALRRIEVIREYWSGFDARGPDFFPIDAFARSHGVRYRASAVLFTTASMVAAVDSVLLGAIAVLALVLGARLEAPTAVPVGAVVGAAAFIVSVVYQRRRLSSSVVDG